MTIKRRTFLAGASALVAPRIPAAHDVIQVTADADPFSMKTPEEIEADIRAFFAASILAMLKDPQTPPSELEGLWPT